MTLSWLQILSVLFVPVLLGAGLLRLQGVVPRTDPLAYCGWAWLQGCVGLALLLSAWLWLALPLSAGWIGAVACAAAGLAFALGRRIPVAAELDVPVRHPSWENACFALALSLLLLSTVDRILLASADVLVSSDETRIWAAKARILFHAGGFGPEFRAALQPEVIAHADYPPLNPLLQLWVHAHAGELVHVESRLPIQVFALAGILVAASALRRRARPLVAALFLVCIGTLGRFFTYQVFSDALIAIGLFACWDLWQRYQEDGALVWLRLLGCTAPVLVWSKNEGTLHVLAFGLALLAAALARRVRLPERRDRWRALAWSAPLLASVLYLVWFNAHFGLVNDLVLGSPEMVDADGIQDAPGFTGLAMERAGQNAWPIVTSFANLICQASLTRYLLLAFLVLVLASPRSAFGRGRLVFTLGLLLGLLGYMAVYLGTHWEVEVHLAHSAHRLVYHLTPAAGLWVLLSVVDAVPWLSARGRAAAEPAGSGSARATMPA